MQIQNSKSCGRCRAMFTQLTENNPGSACNNPSALKHSIVLGLTANVREEIKSQETAGESVLFKEDEIKWERILGKDKF